MLFGTPHLALCLLCSYLCHWLDCKNIFAVDCLFNATPAGCPHNGNTATAFGEISIKLNCLQASIIGAENRTR